MSRENSLFTLSDNELVAAHAVQPVNNYFLSEMLRRHKNVSEDIGRRIWWLNLFLLFFTVAIAGLTFVQVWFHD